jgi:hypothetical protein
LDKYINQLYFKYKNYIAKNNFYYGIVDNKIQFICNCIANDYNNKYTLVFYYSNKYSRYQVVFLKQFSYTLLIGDVYKYGSSFVNGTYIYGRKLITGNSILGSPPAFNSE